MPPLSSVCDRRSSARQFVDAHLECLVGGFQLEYAPRSSQVHTFGEQFDDPAEHLEIAIAVAAGSSRRSRGGYEPLPLVETQGLFANSDKFGRYGNAVEPATIAHQVSKILASAT
jgi:hypothetical protein